MTKANQDLIKKLEIQAARALEEKANTEALFASIGEGVIATDTKGTIIRVNKPALEILGYRKTDLIGHWFTEAVVAVNVDGSIVDNQQRPIAKAYLTGRTIIERIYYMRNDGTIIPVLVNVSPVLMRGKPIGAILIFRDMSEEMRNDRLKMDFIGIASHQLRTPLTAVVTYAHMLEENFGGKLSDIQLSFVNVIITASRRMNELVGTLLNITRIEAGNIRVEPKLVQIENIVQEIMDELKPEADSKRIKLDLAVKAELERIKTDKLLVHEVFANIISNAIKYTPPGGKIMITITDRFNDIVVSVKDNGYGIPVEDQRYIFIKFFRSSDAMKHDVSGTGLGLYLTKVLVDNLGGEIWFKSLRNKGTTFFVSLPRSGLERKAGQFTLEI
ncbi:MAG TPA: ATP-binding protein [Candidatus Saccharimonadales bacterium]|jgi:two-component system sensor histidine kinase VicK|nr:ATP-binding protein [Candidatus Saccharimonadales bacterium]